MDMTVYREQEESYREFAERLRGITATTIVYAEPNLLIQMFQLAASTIMRQSDTLHALIQTIEQLQYDMKE